MRNIPELMAIAKNKRVGVFGGTFDPIHFGHLIVAEAIRERCRLDTIIFLPARLHALKDNQRIESAQHRVKMLQLAIKGYPEFVMNDIEIRRDEVSYTVDTMSRLREEFPDDQYERFFLMGSDNVEQLHRWKEPQRLLETCSIIAFGRAGVAETYRNSPFFDQLQFVDVPQIDISSTIVRDRCRSGESIRFLVPPEVRNYIEDKALYRE